LVTVEYGVKGALPLPSEGDFLLVTIPPGGLLRTSSAIEYGVAKDEYYYYSVTGRVRLRGTGPAAGQMIWDGHIGGYGDEAMVAKRKEGTTVFTSNPDKVAESFFVGSQAQFKDRISAPKRPGTEAQRSPTQRA